MLTKINCVHIACRIKPALQKSDGHHELDFTVVCAWQLTTNNNRYAYEIC